VGRSSKPCIYVLAGTNGAGKSSIAGAAFNKRGGLYLNPDAAARLIREADPSLSVEEANSLAWQQGRRLLERAIAQRCDFAFETTLGGRTMAALLEKAAEVGMEVRVWYAGLSSPELHIARVHKRRARGGHDIPEGDIRRRYDASRLNLVQLLPVLTELRVYDNSVEADLEGGKPPDLRLVLHTANGRIEGPANLERTPEWAKPIVAAALKLAGRRRSGRSRSRTD
jgi:predicted ABC-type ATPase